MCHPVRDAFGPLLKPFCPLWLVSYPTRRDLITLTLLKMETDRTHQQKHDPILHGWFNPKPFFRLYVVLSLLTCSISASVFSPLYFTLVLRNKALLGLCCLFFSSLQTGCLPSLSGALWAFRERFCKLPPRGFFRVCFGCVCTNQCLLFYLLAGAGFSCEKNPSYKKLKKTRDGMVLFGWVLQNWNSSTAQPSMQFH